MKKDFRLLIAILCFSLAGTGYAQDWASGSSPKGPASDAQVLVIFVDSLRPDTVEVMVQQNKLPNIKKLFFDKGLRFQNFFTAFPSLTVNATGCLITGKWQDQTGLKAQSLFERFPVHKKSIVKRMFSAHEHFPRHFNMLTRVEKAAEVLKQNKIKAFYDYLGEKYHTALVPVSPAVVPWAWPHIAANDVDHPYSVATEAPEIVDDLNGKYALRYMVPDTRGKLFMIWFPQMDEEQHLREKGQFSEEAQKRLENVDQWLGKIYDGLIQESRGREPYVILFSDHGAYGGEDGIYNQPYYLGRDFFYQFLKMNLRGPDHSANHPGTDLESYTYIDNMGRGQARIFLPLGDSSSGKWDRPNTLYELEHYGLGPNRKPINLVQELLDINLEARNKFPGKIDPHPVNFVFVKLSEELLYVLGQGGAKALIHIENKNGTLRYRYQPVENLSQSENGRLTYKETLALDPFGYLKDPKFHAEDAVKFIQGFHNDQEWLEATYETAYPDAITALARAWSWRPELSALAKSQDPDLWLSAAPGWNFRYEDINGADHGALLRDALRSTLMISGPHIRAGVDPTPHRIIDLTPTLLQLMSYTGKTDLDSVPIEGIYENS
ncbi:MAG: alkaline phosphatase family protein [Candidatus Omnitrophota bacterium]